MNTLQLLSKPDLKILGFWKKSNLIRKAKLKCQVSQFRRRNTNLAVVDDSIKFQAKSTPKPFERIIQVPDSVFLEVTIGVNASDADRE